MTRLGMVLAAAMLALYTVPLAAQPPADAPGKGKGDGVPGLEALKAKAKDKQKPIRVIARLSGTAAPNTLAQSLRGAGARHAEPLDDLPMVVAELDEAGLQALAASGSVELIAEDEAHHPMLPQSVPLVQAPEVWKRGHNGTSQVVAVLDTGFDTSHPFLAGRIAEEACFSTNSVAYKISPLCPNGRTSQTGTGSAVACTYSGCTHGTHVAGIALGAASAINGVGPGARLLAVQIFSKVDDPDQCGGTAPCVLTYLSDELRALQWVSKQIKKLPIASINMSVGGGEYAEPCDTNMLKSNIDQLRAAGIPTVIASGNYGYANAVTSPACISSAIAVGATNKDDVIGTVIKNGAPYTYSDGSPMVKLLAPGTDILSSIPGGGYATKWGTSMAAPHVAGAWAVLKSQKPTATVDQVLSAFADTGKPITDPRNGLIKPRIDVDAAALALSGAVGMTGMTGAGGMSGMSGMSGKGGK